MTTAIILGGTGRLGVHVARRLMAQGVRVEPWSRMGGAEPGAVDYVIACQRARDGQDEYTASVVKTRELLERLKPSVCVAVSSVLAQRPGDQPSSYSEGKAALEAMCRWFAANTTTRCNVVAPCAFRAGHLTEAEVVNAILWLLSDDASGVNGQTVVVDKGLGLMWQP